MIKLSDCINTSDLPTTVTSVFGNCDFVEFFNLKVHELLIQSIRMQPLLEKSKYLTQDDKKNPLLLPQKGFFW